MAKGADTVPVCDSRDLFVGGQSAALTAFYWLAYIPVLYRRHFTLNPAAHRIPLELR